MEEDSQPDVVEGDDQHWNEIIKHKLAEDHLVVMLVDGGEADAEVRLAGIHDLFLGEHAQRQADEEAQSPGQHHHEDDQVHGGRLVGVGDDHGACHRDGTQRVGAGRQAEGQQELVDLAGGVVQRPGVADGGVQGDGDEQEGEEVGQSHAEEEHVQAVLAQRVVLGKEGEDQQVGAEANAEDHSTGTDKDQPVRVGDSHLEGKIKYPSLIVLHQELVYTNQLIFTCNY